MGIQMLKKTGLLIFAFLLVGALAILVLRNSILESLIEHKANQYGLPLSLEVVSTTPSTLKLRNVKMGSAAVVDQVELEFAFRGFKRPEIKSVSISAKEIDVDSVLKIYAPSEDGGDVDASSLFQLFCEVQQEADFLVSIENMHSRKYRVSSNISVANEKKEKKLTVKLSPESFLLLNCQESLPNLTAENLSFESSYSNLEGIAFEKVELKIQQMKVQPQGKDFEVQAAFHTNSQGELYGVSILRAETSGEVRGVLSQREIRELKVQQKVKNLSLKRGRKETFEISGNLVSEIQGHLQPLKLKVSLKGQEFSVNSSYGTFTGIQFSHVFPRIPEIFTREGQTLSIQSAEIGEKIEKISLNYEVKNKELIGISNVKLKLMGTDVSTNSFDFNFVRWNSSITTVSVQGLSLEILLKLALDHSVRALGLLDGKVSFQFVNSVPVIREGEFHAREKGWIKYRPPGSRPPSDKEIPSDAKIILDRYLYDFQYKSLTANMHSELDYSAYVNLKSLGRNPRYLNGKPLKLSVNLEANLKNAMKSYAITNGLPEKLQDILIGGKTK